MDQCRILVTVRLKPPNDEWWNVLLRKRKGKRKEKRKGKEKKRKRKRKRKKRKEEKKNGLAHINIALLKLSPGPPDGKTCVR